MHVAKGLWLVGLGLVLLVACTTSVPPVPVTYVLNVNVDASDGSAGSVVSSPPGINTTGSQSAVFAQGTVVTLTAVAAEGSVFAGFVPSEVCEPGTAEGVCTLTLEAATSVSVVFVSDDVPPGPETFSVSLTGDGSGAVVSAPAGIDTAGGVFSHDFDVDSVVTLTAVAAEGSVFAGFVPSEVCEPETAEGVCVTVVSAPLSMSVLFRSDTGPTPFPDNLDVVVSEPVAGAFVEFTVPEGVTLASVVRLRNGVLARASMAGDSVRVAWVSEDAQQGNQVRLSFTTASGTLGAPEIVSAHVVERYDGPDVGASSVSLIPASGSVSSTVPLTVTTADHRTVDTTLRAWYADHPLGDLDGDGVLSISDALWLLQRTVDRAWTDFQRYHADLDANDVTDTDDLRRLLDKLVDPELPARLHVKPSAISFAQLDSVTDEDAIVLIANQGRLPLTGLSWSAPTGVVTVDLGGMVNQSAAIGLTLPATARPGWLPGFFRVTHGGEEVDVRVGHLVFLIAGQSNAVGLGSPLTGWPEVPRPEIRMLGNDYRWRDAVEPLDDSTGQLDSVSDDGTFVRYSFGTRLGNVLHDATGFSTYLIPAAKGATALATGVWRPTNGHGVLDRMQLFGSANYRAQVSGGLQPNPVTSQARPAEGGPVTAVIWYQGESDRRSSRRSEFVSNTNEVIDAFAQELRVPTVAVQLGSFCTEPDNARIHAVSELQRRLETGSGEAEERSGYHLVVTFDLPRSDCIHLSAVGQRVLAERISLAVREHVLGEPIDGTGPRITGITYESNVVTVRTTHVLAPGNLAPEFFTVWDGPPQGTLDDPNGGYLDNVIPVLSVARSNSDLTAVRIVLSEPLSVGAEPYVRYMSPPKLPCCSSATPSDPEVWDVVAGGVVRAANGGLPLPAFGPRSPFGGP